jgi:hypothetical protein
VTSGCELCEAAVLTTRHYDDDICWIADCEVCRVPMVVWRVHDATPPEDVRARLLELLAAVADVVLGEGAWKVDDVMRNIPDHYHAHARRPFAWPLG